MLAAAALCFLAAVDGAVAQPASRRLPSLDPSKPIHHYVHEIWTVDDGLPSRTVRDIAQTPDGYLWLATPAGLVRFDGVRFKTFDTRNTPGLPTNFLTTLSASRDGTLWIGSNSGLVRYRDREFSTWTTADGLAGEVVQGLLEDGDGVLWIAAGGQAHRLSGGRISLLERPDPFAEGWVNSVVEGADGTFWLTTRSHGVIQWRQDRWRRLTTADGLPTDRLRYGARDRAGAIWLAEGPTVEPGGLVRYDDGEFVDHSDDVLIQGNIQAIHASRNGSVWIAFSGGVLRFLDGRFETFEPASLDLRFKALYEDREGSLWIGTYAEGLHRLSAGPFTTYSALDGLAGGPVKAIYEDRSQNLWAGDAGGLSRYENGRFVAVADVPFPIRAIGEDREGSLWLGTSDALLRYAEGRVTRYPTDHPVTLVFADRQGRLHVGFGIAGLQRFDAGVFTAVEEFRDSFVRWAHEDRAGNRWFGTSDRGLGLQEGDRVSWLGRADGLSTEALLSFHQGDEGTLWMGTEGGGLLRLKEGAITRYGLADGLHDDSIWPILEDDHENLWMGGDRGIFRVSKQDLSDFDAGRITTIPSVVYGVADGLKTEEGYGLGAPSGWKTHDGRLWFATTQGVAMVDPSRLGEAPPPPPVVIEEILVEGEELAGDEPLSVPPLAGELEIRYSALSFVKPDQIRFQYRLVGYEQAWRDAGSRRTAYYGNLPPRGYRFEVRARHGNGEWAESVAAVGLSVHPAWWQTWWLRSGAVLAVAALITAAYRLRIRAVRRRAQMLERKEAWSRSILDSLGGSVVVLDPRGVIVRVNEAWKRFGRANGASPELIEGRGWDYLETCRRASGSAADSARRALTGIKCVLDGVAESFDLEYQSDSAEMRRWFLMRAVPLDSPAGGAVISHIDITEGKLAQEDLDNARQRLLRQRDELAHLQRTAAMGELTAALSHEISQPLTAIRSNAEVAVRSLESGRPDLPQLREILGDVLEDERRTTEIIRHARGLLKKQPLATKLLEVNGLIEEIAALLHSDGVMKRIEVELDLTDGLPAVRGDRVQLQQVLLNLMMNGFDALERVPQKERRMLLRSARGESGYVRISVEDNGPGFDERSRDRMFEAFQTTKRKGLGMGLSIARSIVETHSGRIWAESDPKGGARFHVELPAAGR